MPFILGFFAFVFIVAAFSSYSEKKEHEQKEQEKLSKQREAQQRRFVKEQERHRAKIAKEREKEQLRIEKQIKKENESVSKKICSCSDKIAYSTSLSSLLKNLEAAKDYLHQLEYTTTSNLDSYTLHRISTLRDICCHNRHETIKNYLSVQYNKLLQNALTPITFEEFEKDLESFFRQIDQCFDSLPNSIKVYANQLKLSFSEEFLE